jgi:hypothetical protein
MTFLADLAMIWLVLTVVGAVVRAVCHAIRLPAWRHEYAEQR